MSMRQGKVRAISPKMYRHWLLDDITDYDFSKYINMYNLYDEIKAAVQKKVGAPVKGKHQSAHLDVAVVNTKVVIL